MSVFFSLALGFPDSTTFLWHDVSSLGRLSPCSRRTLRTARVDARPPQKPSGCASARCYSREAGDPEPPVFGALGPSVYRLRGAEREREKTYADGARLWRSSAEQAFVAMSGLFGRVFGYVFNELLVSGLANSRTFQQFAVRTDRALREVQQSGE